MKIPATLLLLGGLVYGAYWYLAIHLPEKRRERDDPIYAAAVFDSVLPYETVLATRRWHRRGAEAWDCTYAIVSLPGTARPDPPGRPAGQSRPWYLAYGGDWQPTPAAPLMRGTRDALGFCGQYWSETLNSALNSAMTEPGSWYVRDRVGETLHLYSAPQRIAARIRFGD